VEPIVIALERKNILTLVNSNMIKIIKSATILVFSIAFLLAYTHSTHADEFEVFLHYNALTETLSFNRDMPEAVRLNALKDFSIIDFDNLSSDGPFNIVCIDVDGYEIRSRKIQPEQGDFIIEFPYFGTAKTFGIQQVSTGEMIDTFDVSKYIQCNNNGTCEYELGENTNTCLADCYTGSPKSSETENILKQNNDVIYNKKGDVVLRGDSVQLNNTTQKQSPPEETKVWKRWLIIAGGFTILIVIIGIVINIRKKSKNN